MPVLPDITCAVWDGRRDLNSPLLDSQICSVTLCVTSSVPIFWGWKRD